MGLFAHLAGAVTGQYRRFCRHMIQAEYCAWATPYLRWLRRPLIVLAGVATAALLCGLFVAPQGFVVFAAIIAVITIGCVWPWIGIRGISCHLSFASTRTEEGKPVEATLVVTNRWPWPVWGLAVEGGFEREKQSEEQTAIAVSRIGGWTRGHYSWSFTPTMRGQYPIGCPQLVTEFPFGLWKARKHVHVASSVIAWPRRFPLPPLSLQSGTQSWVGQPSEGASGSLGHRTTVREYRQGDSMRQIHWAKTALYEKLVSYEREGLAVADATIKLDTHPSLHSESGPDSTLEWSIRIAASVADALLRQGVSVTLVSHAAWFRSVSAGNNCGTMLDWLAVLDVSGRSARESQAMGAASRSLTALTVHITTDLSDAAAGDSIVLLTDKRSLSPRGRTTADGWMTVSTSADVPMQICKGWRSGPRRIRHAC